jgi:hypothetical protein
MATVYVSTLGSDAYTYVQAQSILTPWLSLAKCNASATTGDTIIMANGTYAWANITWTKSFTILATTNGLVILDAVGASAGFVQNSSSTIVWTGIEFCNSTKTTGTFLTENQVGVVATIANTFNSCVFRRLKGGNSATDGMIAVTMNNFGSPSFYSLTFNSCIFDKCGISTARLFYVRVQSNASILVQVINNCSFYFDSNYYPSSIFVSGASFNPIVKNSIFANNSGSVVSWSDGTPTYSDFFNITSSPAGTGNITTDPLFVDAPNGNFNLRPTSPCIDKGTLI